MHALQRRILASTARFRIQSQLGRLACREQGREIGWLLGSISTGGASANRGRICLRDESLYGTQRGYSQVTAIKVWKASGLALLWRQNRQDDHHSTSRICTPAIFGTAAVSWSASASLFIFRYAPTCQFSIFKRQSILPSVTLTMTPANPVKQP